MYVCLSVCVHRCDDDDEDDDDAVDELGPILSDLSA